MDRLAGILNKHRSQEAQRLFEVIINISCHMNQSTTKRCDETTERNTTTTNTHKTAMERHEITIKREEFATERNSMFLTGAWWGDIRQVTTVHMCCCTVNCMG